MASSSPTAPEWKLSTATPYHVSPDRSAFAAFHTLDPAEFTDNVWVSGQRVVSQGVGTIVVDLDGGCLVLKDARYIPSCPSNVVSVGSLVRQGYRLSMHSGGDYYSIKAPDGSEFEAAIDPENAIFKAYKLHTSIRFL